MIFPSLSSDSLIRSLEAVVGANSEVSCAAAVVSAATMIQAAVLANQDPDQVVSALDQAADVYPQALRLVVDRAVDFQDVENGDSYGLWLLPVQLEHTEALAATIALDGTGLKSLRAASALLKQLRLTAEDAPARKPGELPQVGWVYAVPMLYSDESLRQADLKALIDLPVLARDVVLGKRACAVLRTEADFVMAAGVSTYYLPLIVKHPQGRGRGLTQPSEQSVRAVQSWINSSMALEDREDVLAVRVLERPHPFSTAMDVGKRAQLDMVFRRNVQALLERTGVAPGALSVLISLYSVVNRNEDARIGVSIVSRLTGAPLATITMSVHDQEGHDEVYILGQAVRDLGVTDVTVSTRPVRTFSCQACQSMQMKMPVPDKLPNMQASTSLH